jgi:hypothetical protein
MAVNATGKRCDFILSELVEDTPRAYQNTRHPVGKTLEGTDPHFPGQRAAP